MVILNMAYLKSSWWWKPNASRTLFYYEFEQNLNDSSWNWNNATWSNIGYEELNWQYVIKPTAANSNLTFPASVYPNIWTWDFAFSIRMYWPTASTLSSSNYYTIFEYVRVYNNASQWPNIWYWWPAQKLAFRLYDNNVYYWPTRSELQWKRNHIVFTRISGVCYWYCNWVLVAQRNWNDNMVSLTSTHIWFRWDYNPRPSNSWLKYDKAIFEKVWWTPQEVLGYYYQTKNDYWL